VDVLQFSVVLFIVTDYDLIFIFKRIFFDEKCPIGLFTIIKIRTFDFEANIFGQILNRTNECLRLRITLHFYQ
jgi:hypothetical protein